MSKNLQRDCTEKGNTPAECISYSSLVIVLTGSSFRAGFSSFLGCPLRARQRQRTTGQRMGTEVWGLCFSLNPKGYSSQSWLIFEWETFLKEMLLYVISLLHSSAEGCIPSFLAQASALCLWPFQTQETSVSSSLKCPWTNHTFCSLSSILYLSLLQASSFTCQMT